tara:strand:- start:532 stop:735 length:204 start_codon:yes stop_codon:yes gene_type:complete
VTSSDKNKKKMKYSDFIKSQQPTIPSRELNESLEATLSKIRRMYRNGKLMTFREWAEEFGEILDSLG